MGTRNKNDSFTTYCNLGERAKPRTRGRGARRSIEFSNAFSHSHRYSNRSKKQKSSRRHQLTSLTVSAKADPTDRSAQAAPSKIRNFTHTYVVQQWKDPFLRTCNHRTPAFHSFITVPPTLLISPLPISIKRKASSPSNVSVSVLGFHVPSVFELIVNGLAWVRFRPSTVTTVVRKWIQSVICFISSLRLQPLLAWLTTTTHKFRRCGSRSGNGGFAGSVHHEDLPKFPLIPVFLYCCKIHVMMIGNTTQFQFVSRSFWRMFICENWVVSYRVVWSITNLYSISLSLSLFQFLFHRFGHQLSGQFLCLRGASIVVVRNSIESQQLQLQQTWRVLICNIVLPFKCEYFILSSVPIRSFLSSLLFVIVRLSVFPHSVNTLGVVHVLPSDRYYWLLI